MTSTINASTSAGLVNTADTSGILQLQTANTAALTIDASQNVGIGTSSPYAQLALGSASALTNYQGALFGVTLPTGSGSWLEFSENSTNGSSFRISKDSTTGVLINTNYKAIGFKANGYSTAVSAANVVIDTSGNLQFNSGYGSAATAYGCRAWVSFDGTLTSPITPRGSGNISSITKQATGKYTLNMTTAMPDANYVAMVGGSPTTGAAYSSQQVFNNQNGSTEAPTTSSFKIVNLTGGFGAYADSAYILVTVFR